MYKFGKKAPRKHLSTPSLGNFLSTEKTWPVVSAQGWEYAVPANQLQMLGNDQYGDCAEAGAMHLIQVQTANTGTPLQGTLQQTLDLYTAVTGFNPSDPSTDQGTDLLSLLQYWKNTGITVTNAAGKEVVHKILGWAALDLTSVAQIRWASDMFGGTYLGINCPESAEQNTSDWDVVPGSPIMGGHCITGTGQGSTGGHIISWGMNIPFTWNFMHQYLDEAFVIVTNDWVNAQGKSPSGLDLDGLLAAMKQITN